MSGKLHLPPWIAVQWMAVPRSARKILPGGFPLRRAVALMATSGRPEPSPPPRLRLSESGEARRARRRSEREENPVPFVTYILLAIIIVLFYGMWLAGKGNPSLVARQFGSKENALIFEGQIWRLVTPIFLHGNLTHLLTNAISLYWFGTQLERFYGWRKFLLIYLFAGIVGNVVSLLNPAPSLGASGALFGLIGAGLIFPLRFRALIPEKARNYILSQLLLITAINLGLGFSIPHVDNWAHMGGLVGGAFIALFLIPDGLEEKPPARIWNRILTVVVTGSLLLVGWSAYAQWRWKEDFASPPLREFGSERTNPWWSVRVPQRWRFDPVRGIWHNADGALLQIADSDHNPELVEEVVQRLLDLKRQQKSPVNILLIDGKEALHFRFANQQSVQEIYAVFIEGRWVILQIWHRTNDTPVTQHDILTIRDSIRFIRSPNTAADRPSRVLWPVRIQP
jgi:membrane associated rhomboid family serine protease